MAKNNINLGTLSGKLGDNVFWRTHGQQRVRTYFKKEDVAVGYEAAERQSRFANLKSIYQWLPANFKQACNLYKVGGNPYADFMRQYNQFGMGRDKQGFGAGRFLPVECAVSNGTFNMTANTMFRQCTAFISGSPKPIVPALVLPCVDDNFDSNSWADFSTSLLETYKTLREGDYMHILLAYVFFDGDTWGNADYVAGFPFPYTGTKYFRLKIDVNSNITFNNTNSYQIWLCGGYMDDGNEKPCMGFSLANSVIPVGAYNYASVCGALMFERPTNTRQQRYSPAKLSFDRSQIKILSPQMQGHWNDYAASSYVRTT